MRSSKPPVLAVWLFQHLTRREHREALAGDLLEEYSRRSDSWYWRQVLAAIAADFRTALRSRWVCVVLALVDCGAFPWKQLFLNERFQSFLFAGIQLRWPGSLLAGIAIISAFQGVILVVALGAYVVGTNNFHRRNFLSALYPALFVLDLRKRCRSNLAAITLVAPVFLLCDLATAFVLQRCDFEDADACELRTDPPSLQLRQGRLLVPNYERPSKEIVSPTIRGITLVWNFKESQVHHLLFPQNLHRVQSGRPRRRNQTCADRR